MAKNSFSGTYGNCEMEIMHQNIKSHSETEAVVKRCSAKKVLLKISQISQEIICARVSFLIKLQASSLHFYQKRESGTGVFL